VLKLALAISLVIFSLCPELVAQACGFSYAKFLVTDASGTPVRNATFEFLKKDANEVGIHSPKALQWSEEGRSYFLSEGMCSGHNDIRVKIEASGYDVIEGIIDLPLTNFKHPWVYRIQLKKRGSDQNSSFEYLSELKGTIFDGNGSVVPSAKVRAKDVKGRAFSTVANEAGEYSLELPYNRYVPSGGPPEAKYTVTVEQTGFAKTIIEYIFVPSQFGSMRLDIGLAVKVFNH
jgi:hypothetical protein